MTRRGKRGKLANRNNKKGGRIVDKAQRKIKSLQFSHKYKWNLITYKDVQILYDSGENYIEKLHNDKILDDRGVLE